MQCSLGRFEVSLVCLVNGGQGHTSVGDLEWPPY